MCIENVNSPNAKLKRLLRPPLTRISRKAIFGVTKMTRKNHAFMMSTFSLCIKRGEKMLCSKQDFLLKLRNCFVPFGHQRNTFR